MHNKLMLVMGNLCVHVGKDMMTGSSRPGSWLLQPARHHWKISMFMILVVGRGGQDDDCSLTQFGTMMLASFAWYTTL